MQRILINVLNNGEGGTEQCLRMIARFYAKRGVKVDVLILDHNLSNKFWDNLDLEESQVTIYKSSKKSELFGFFYLLTFFLKSIKYDMIFTSHLKMTLIIGVLMRLKLIPKTKFVARESYSSFIDISGLKKQIYRFLYLFGYKKVDLLICQTDAMKKQFDENIYEYASKSVVIKNPIDLHLIKSNENKINKDELNWLQNNEYIVAAGRLDYWKGYDLLIEAFKSIKKERPQFKLLILGEGEDREKLSNLISQLELEKDVMLKGFTDNVYPYFKQAALCVVSSRCEGFPNVLLQMMSQNNNVVSTKCAGGIVDIEGVYSCEVSVDSLAERMEECLNNDNSRNYFEEYLNKQSIEKFIFKIDELLK